MPLPLTKQFSRINNLFEQIAQEESLPVEQLVRRWYASVKGKKCGRTLWNTYQAYISHETYGAVERRKLAVNGRTPPGNALSRHEIASCYNSFKAQVSNWQDILDTFEAYQAPNKRHEKTFDQNVVLVEQLLERLQKSGIDGAIVLASEKRTHTYETDFAQGLIMSWPAFTYMPTESNGGYSDLISRQSVALAWPQTTNLDSTADASQVDQALVPVHSPPSPPQAASSASHQHPPITKLSEHLRDAYFHDLHTVLPGSNFPWLDLTAHLAAKGLYIDGYPDDVRYPHDTSGARGVQSLSTAEQCSMSRALEGERRLKFRAYPGNSQGTSSYHLRHDPSDNSILSPLQDLQNSMYPVIVSRDKRGELVKFLFLNREVAHSHYNNGPYWNPVLEIVDGYIRKRRR
ncbi:hypothetical protein C8R43DRAFT_946852 [Mycena crocata]|nr:hypothetical protein C8R43DRAFT_946852 [Mycena crocata]